MPDHPPPAIHLSDLSLTFPPNVQVLKNLNLTVTRGRRVALIGRSGSGKTSLLAVIGGLLRPTSGAVRTLGQDATAMDEDALAALRRDNIGVVFQHFHLIDTMTAQENAALPLELAGEPNAQTRARAMLESVGLKDRTTHFPHMLSGGERQRVAIARAFISNPALILADEPTGNLDDATSDQVLTLLLDIGRQNNATMLFVTHNTAILSQFDEIWEMKNGAVHPRPHTPT